MMKATLTGPMEFIPAPDPTPQFIEVTGWAAHRAIIAVSEIVAVDEDGDGDGKTVVHFRDGRKTSYSHPSFDEFAELLVRRPERRRQPMMVSYGTEHNALGTDAGRDG